MDLYTRALIFATNAHGSQKRKYTNEPYITHPIEVSMTLQVMGFSEEMQAAALLHDVLEDTEVSYHNLTWQFPESVAKLVMELTEGSFPGNRKERKRLECARLSKISSDAQTIKYADLISNTKSIMQYDSKFAKLYLEEKRAILSVMDKGNSYLYDVACRICGE